VSRLDAQQKSPVAIAKVNNYPPLLNGS
jgi:hypothetical protein